MDESVMVRSLRLLVTGLQSAKNVLLRGFRKDTAAYRQLFISRIGFFRIALR